MLSQRSDGLERLVKDIAQMEIPELGVSQALPQFVTHPETITTLQPAMSVSTQ